MYPQRRSLAGLLLATLFTVAGIPSAPAQDDTALAYYREAKINWRQAEGQTLTIGLNKHPFTKSLLPLIPEFRRLTGINVEYLILPEAEYFTKLVADLSQQRGEFSVIMTGPMRNWQYVPPDWILPLDDFLNNPKLTDLSWYKLEEDLYPALIAANRWNGKTGRGRRGAALLEFPSARGELQSLHLTRTSRTSIKSANLLPTIEEMAEAARQVKKAQGMPGIVARGTRNSHNCAHRLHERVEVVHRPVRGDWSELDGKLNGNLHDPNSVKMVLHPRHVRGSATRPTKSSRRTRRARSCSGTMPWRPSPQVRSCMISDAHFFAANYEDPKKSKVAGKVGYALLPVGPGGKTYAGLWTWALGISKAAQEQGSAWLFVQWATAPRSLLSHRRLPQLQSVPCLGTNDLRLQEIMGSWGGGCYLAPSPNLETARVAWTPQSERARVGDIWARALHEVYFQRLSAADALKKERRGRQGAEGSRREVTEPDRCVPNQTAGVGAQ